MAGIEELAEPRGGVTWDQLVHLLGLVQNRAERRRHVLDGIPRRLRVELLSDEGTNLGGFDLGEGELAEHGQEVVLEDLAVVVLGAGLAVRRDGLREPPFRVLRQSRHARSGWRRQDGRVALGESRPNLDRRELSRLTIPDPPGLAPTMVVDEQPPNP